MAINLAGRIFGRLTVLERSKESKPKAVKWVCLCECGNKISTRTWCLTSGGTVSCRCYANERTPPTFRDLTGQTFGQLTAISYKRATAEERGFWWCKCSCGKTVRCTPSNLRQGSKTSCGCLIIKQKAERRAWFIGRRFGRLIVTSEAPSLQSHKSRFHCLCDCGTIAIVRGSALQQGTVSCGCAVVHRDPALRSERQKTKGRQFRHTRLARLRGAIGVFTDSDILVRLSWQKGKCAAPNCRTHISLTTCHIDHIEPLSPRRSRSQNRIGLNEARNIQLLCEPCNLSKQDKDPIEWAQSCGVLI